jgi:hypothetical protein
MGDGNSSETKNTEVDNQNPDIDPGENDFRSTSCHVMLIVATGPHTFIYMYSRCLVPIRFRKHVYEVFLVLVWSCFLENGKHDNNRASTFK